MTKSTKFSGAAANTRVLSRLDGLFADDAARREVRREARAGAPPDRPPDDAPPGRRLLAGDHAGTPPPLSGGSGVNRAETHRPVPARPGSVLPDSVLPAPVAPVPVRPDPVPPAPGRTDPGAAEEGDGWERLFARLSDQDASDASDTCDASDTSVGAATVVTGGQDTARLPAVPLRGRVADAVADRIPPHLKALRVGMDRRAVAAVAVLALLAVVLAGAGWWRARPQAVAVPPVVGGSTRATSGPGAERARVAPGPGSPAAVMVPGVEASAVPTAPPTVSVHVVGKVAQPGVLALPAGSRVDDALKAAGGVLPGTDLSVLNLARVLVDGEQIPVGVPGATAPPPVPAAVPGPAAAGAGGGKAAAGGVVDLNTATAEQLDALPGIGPVMAAHILDWRREHGRFTSVDQLREIRGIGARRLEEIRSKVRV
ncbi:helix-hairpin-helix domain-containing protein [Uniformispora flossi]|uniref:helix-hairpin-helix domain-containing protein n=1 Tax=Uniformispora flossi TaxID=3390723 RepID=UPI003C302456